MRPARAGSTFAVPNETLKADLTELKTELERFKGLVETLERARTELELDQEQKARELERQAKDLEMRLQQLNEQKEIIRDLRQQLEALQRQPGQPVSQEQVDNLAASIEHQEKVVEVASEQLDSRIRSLPYGELGAYMAAYQNSPVWAETRAAIARVVTQNAQWSKELQPAFQAAVRAAAAGAVASPALQSAAQAAAKSLLEAQALHNADGDQGSTETHRSFQVSENDGSV